MKVTVDDPGGMSLLGLLLAGLLERRFAAGARTALRGDVGIDAGGMLVTLSFSADEVRVARGRPARARARIRGTLVALLDAALGRNEVRAFLRGDLRPAGSPLALLRLLRLLKA
jgi:hypothetical protein